jgi:5-methylthioadenosine/S-adenosylhomocysteine deaminase
MEGDAVIDLLIRQATVVPVAGPVRPACDIAIDGGAIVALGPGLPFAARRVIDGHERIVIPGLINAHTHLALTVCRGISHGDLSALYDVMWAVEQHITGEDVADLALLGALECLRGGTTCVNDHYFFAEQVAQSLTTLGIRALVGHTVMASGGPWVGDAELAEALAFVARWHGRDPLVTPTLAPHAADTTTGPWLQALYAAAERYDALFHIHVAQTDREVATITARGGRSPVAYLAGLGVLGPRTLAVHCTRVDDADLALLLASGCAPVYCPTVHGLRGRVLRAAELRERGARVALGTDCAAGNDDYDMLEELRQAIAGQRIIRRSASLIQPAEALAWATRDNALALGLADRVGVIAPGMRADLVVVRSDTPRMTPCLDPVNTLVMCAGEREVEHVIVDGRVLIDAGVATSVDERSVVRRGRAAAERVIERALRAGASLPGLSRG